MVGEFDWPKVEKTKGKYDFSQMDETLGNFARHGLNLHYRVRPINAIYGTYWDEFGQSDEYPDGHLDDWANFIEKFAERYDGDGVDDASTDPKIVINSYQFVHELTPWDKNYWLSHPEQYAEVFETTYKALKRANPKAVLYMPVRASEILKGSGDNFLRTVLSYLKDKGMIDIGFDYHQFKHGSLVMQEKNIGETAYQLRPKTIDQIKRTASEYGFSNVLIMSGESGWPGTETTESIQADYVIRSYVISLAHGQKRQFWTTITEYGHYDESVIFAHVGLVHNRINKDGISHKKLAYYTYKKMVEVLEGSDWTAVETVREDTVNKVYIYKFTKQGTPIWVAWNDSSVTRTITISGISSNRVKTTKAVPRYESGKQVVDYTTAFQTDTLAVTNGAVMLTLGERPVFVEPLTVTSVEDKRENVPQQFRLYQNYPNPFNPSTTIHFSILRRSHVTLKVFDVLGREVATLVNGELSAGEHSVVFKAEKMASGVYFYRLSADDFVETKKMLIAK